jgi:hypothetical protein
MKNFKELSEREILALAKGHFFCGDALVTKRMVNRVKRCLTLTKMKRAVFMRVY